jgi:tetratricopeptide (TPR) repeat protein
MPAEAIDELQLVSKSLRGPRRAAILGYAYAVCGKTEEARQILKTLLSESQRESFPALSIAQVYIGLGEKDRAFEWLEKAIDQRDLDLSLEWNVMYAPLRTDARFAKLLQRMKIV